MIPFRHHPLPQAQDAFRRFRSQPKARLYGPPPPCPP
jgi:hypothetical protein